MFKYIYVMQQRPKNIFWNYFWHLAGILAIFIFGVQFITYSYEFIAFKTMSHDTAMQQYFSKTEYYYELETNTKDVSLYMNEDEGSIYIVSNYRIEYEAEDTYIRTITRKPIKHLDIYPENVVDTFEVVLLEGNNIYESYTFSLDELNKSDRIINKFNGLGNWSLIGQLIIFIAYTILFIYVRKTKKYSTYELIS